MNRSSRITRGPDVGCNQGRNSEACRAITEAICRSVWSSTWPLWVLFAAWILCGAVFA